jgi:hypothetical protein
MAARKKATTKKKVEATDSQIAALAHEASVGHDTELVKICGRALSGNAAARKECSRVMMAAKAIHPK